MTDSNSLPNSNPTPAQPEDHSTQRWIPGVVLIVLGAVFLLSNLTRFTLENWWALFILIPALASFGRAYDHYRQSGSINEPVRQGLFGGVILLAVAAIFLFQLSWTLFGPFILIVLGLSMLSREWQRK